MISVKSTPGRPESRADDREKSLHLLATVIGLRCYNMTVRMSPPLSRTPKGIYSHSNLSATKFDDQLKAPSHSFGKKTCQKFSSWKNLFVSSNNLSMTGFK